MPSQKNEFIIASAGSRKTTLLIEKALLLADSRVLITTYTNENLAQIRSYLIEKKGIIPSNVLITSWFSFLLREGVRPYQNHLISKGRIGTILYDEMPQSMKTSTKNNADRYFLTAQNNIHRDRVADFVCQCNERSGGRVLRRLERIYDHILIDEFQDFAGYDLEIAEQLFRSSIKITAVADPRQATYSTNDSQKNKQYRGARIINWINRTERLGLASIEALSKCYRSNQIICDFADALFPEFPKTISMNCESTGHDGIFHIAPNQVSDYMKEHKPVVLRYSRATNTQDLAATNIGVSKGRTYDRVLIFPTAKWRQYLQDKRSDPGDRARLYVAVTRAKYSAAFVLETSSSQ